MTNILFQMQKEIFKLKRRTQHVEQMLTNQTQSGQPVIRIPRLTKGRIDHTSEGENFVFLSILSDELTTICINEKETQQNVAPIVSVDHEPNHTSSSMNNEPLSK